MTSTNSEGLTELVDPIASADLTQYLAGLSSRRSYMWHEAMNELRRRQVTNVLGNLWHLLNPALSILVYYLIFGLLLEVTRGVDNFLLFLTVGMFVFQFTQKATLQGAKSIIGNKGLIRSFKFPRAILPITSTLTEFLASLTTFALMAGVVIIGGGGIRWTWLLFLPMLVVQVFFSLGSAFLAARMSTHFRDTTQILPFLFRLLFYGSGVIYNLDAYTEDNPTLQLLFTFNPIYCFLSFARWAILGGKLQPSIVLSACVWSVVVFFAGFFWFKSGEERYARD